jgi:hypothetical protein
MCLKKVKQTGLNMSGHGFKVMSERPDGDLNPWVYHPEDATAHGYAGKRVEFGVQYTAIEEQIRGEDAEPYTTGFHIFMEEQDAINWTNTYHGVAVRVEFYHGHTIGEELRGGKPIKTIIARLMTVIERVEK